MPRDGLNQYHRPPGTDAVTNYTIESTKYNAYVADIEQDLNLPRPIVAGGTGASDARTAMVNLQGEIAMQGPVTNYDSFPFVSGSFFSNAGATSAPEATRKYAGTCRVVNDGTGDTILTVSNPGTPSFSYRRRKTLGAWLAWETMPGSSTDLDAAYVNVTGDTMTGNLVIAPASGTAATLQLNSTGVAGANIFMDKGTGTGSVANNLFGRVTGTTRWALQLGNEINETGSNVGSDFVVQRYSDAGTYIDSILTITRSNGTATFNKAVAANAAIWSVGSPTTGTFQFGNSGTKSLVYDGTNFTLAGGALTVSGGALTAVGVTSNMSATTGTYYFGNGGTKYLNYDGIQFNFVGGPVVIPGFVSVPNVVLGTNLNLLTDNTNIIIRSGNSGQTYIQNGAGTVNFGLFSTAGLTTPSIITNRTDNAYHHDFNSPSRHWGMAVLADGSLDIDDITAGAQRWSINTSGIVKNANATQCRSGTGGSYGGNSFNLFYNGSATVLWIDNTNFGTINTTSDYRVKKDVIDLPSMWDAVKGLRPIKYTQAEFQPPSQKKYIAEQIAEAKKDAETSVSPREINTAPMFPADDIERWGFIAHELQETLIPSAATGEKDSPDTIQSPNPFTVIAALTKALQEAMTRIEALEAR